MIVGKLLSSGCFGVLSEEGGDPLSSLLEELCRRMRHQLADCWSSAPRRRRLVAHSHDAQTEL